MTKIAVIGGGRIGEALIAGLTGAGGRPVSDVVVAEPSAARAAELTARFGVRVAEVGAAATDADLIVIAVKPADVDAVLGDVAKASVEDRGQLVVSLAAGVTTAKLEARLPDGFPVIRVMPNTPMLVGEGMSVLAPGRYALPKHLDAVSEMLGVLGAVVTVSEDKMDAVTAVSGSGPAYFFLVVEAMVDAAVGLGLPRDTAMTLVVQTMVGSAAMLNRPGASAAELRAAVTSPGGTTAAAVRELERAGVRSAFLEALDAAAARSAELG